MHYTVLSLRGVRMAVVLVEDNQLGWAFANELLSKLQYQLKLPVMLVARSEGRWDKARARADFDAAPYLLALLAAGTVDWTPLPEPEEPDSPF